MTPQFGGNAPVWFIYFLFLFAFCFFRLKHRKPDVLHRSDIYFGTESRNLPDKKKSLRTILESGRSGTEVGEARALSVGDSKGTHRSERAAAAAAAWEREDKASARLGRKARGMNFTRTARSTPHRKRARAADSSTVSLRLTETTHRSVFSVTMASDWAYGHELSLVKTLKECARNWAHDKANR